MALADMPNHPPSQPRQPEQGKTRGQAVAQPKDKEKGMATAAPVESTRFT